MDRKPAAIALHWRWIISVALLGLGVVLAIYLGVPGLVQSQMKAALDCIAPLGAWTPVFFVLLYIAACVALIPGAVLTLGAGALFGVVKGAIFVSIGATLGATAAFLVGRHCARAWVRRKIGHHPTFVAIDQAVADEGWKIVLLTRLSPAFPFFVLNYAYSLTRVRLRDFVWATWIGIMPGSTLFVYIGSLANPGNRAASRAEWTFKIIGVVVAVLVTVYITRRARRALDRRLPPPATRS